MSDDYYYNKEMLFRLGSLEVWWWRKIFYIKHKEGTPEYALENKIKELKLKARRSWGSLNTRKVTK